MAQTHTTVFQNGDVGDGMQVDEMDPRAQLVDISDNEDDCKSL